MITETKVLYRGTSNETGLEILIFAWYLDQGAVPNYSVPHFLVAADDGQVLDLPASQVRLNWRWDQAKHDWADIDSPAQFSTEDAE